MKLSFWMKLAMGLLMVAAKAQATDLISALLDHEMGAAYLCQRKGADTTSPQQFPLFETSDGYETSESMDSPCFGLQKLSDDEIPLGISSDGGQVYAGDFDLWVIVTSKEDSSLPKGFAYKVIKPLDSQGGIKGKPAVFYCRPWS